MNSSGPFKQQQEREKGKVTDDERHWLRVFRAELTDGHQTEKRRATVISGDGRGWKHTNGRNDGGFFSKGCKKLGGFRTELREFHGVD